MACKQTCILSGRRLRAAIVAASTVAVIHVDRRRLRLPEQCGARSFFRGFALPVCGSRCATASSPTRSPSSTALRSLHATTILRH